MSAEASGDFTRLLRQASSTNNDDAVLSAVYTELRALARSRLRSERPGHTLQATALVNEVYLRLVRGANLQFNDRAHFFAAAAEAMRRVLLEHARSRGRQKRGGGRQRVSLDAAELSVQSDPEQFLTVDDAIRRLEEQDQRLAQLVKLRFFAGLGVEETAAAMGVSESTARRDWKLAKAWLARELKSHQA